MVYLEPPRIHYTARPVSFNPQPGRLNWEFTPGTLDLGFQPGQVNIRMVQYPAVKMRAAERKPLDIYI